MLRDREQTAQDSTGATRSYACGKYRLVAELARGGMSIVYLAFDARSGGSPQLLVLKELRPELASDPGVLAMFIEEGRLAATLSHPNVVRTFESGSDGEHHYIAMEYLDGQSLHRILSRSRKAEANLPIELHGAVLCRTLEGLAYAHEATDREGKPMAIVHRDVSPHNVFVDYAGRVKVLDFGIAKMAHSSVNTRTGILKGKVPYMSPEQAAGAALDARSDVFAVGIMLWEALTGRRFWSGMTSETQILRALWQGNLALDNEGAMASIPAPLREVIVKATALDPAARYASARDMLVDLRAALASSGVRLLEGPEIGKLMRDLFADDRVRVRVAIEEALALHKRTSGEYPVTDLAPPSRDSLAPSSRPPAPPAEQGAGMTADPQAARPTRDALIAGAAEVERSVGQLQDSERIASLPQSVEVIARAVRAVGGVEPAVALERLSECMQVVEELDRWRASAVEYLRAGDALPVAAVEMGAAAAITESFAPRALRFVDRLEVRLAAAAAAGVLATSLAFAALGGHGPARATMASTMPPAAAQPLPIKTVAAPPVETLRPEVAHVIVRVTPLSARIVVDQQMVFDNPCVATVPKDGANHVVHVDADGYVPEDHAFVANGDMTIILALQRKSTPRASTQTHAAAPPPPPATPPPAVAPPAPVITPIGGMALAGKPTETCKSE